MQSRRSIYYTLKLMTWEMDQSEMWRFMDPYDGNCGYEDLVEVKEDLEIFKKEVENKKLKRERIVPVYSRRLKWK